MLNLGMNLQRLAAKQVEFTPASLFNKGEAGVWYDPSAASGSLDWRKNLFEYTESFDNSNWTKVNSTVTADSTTAPDGTNTADTLTENTLSGQHRLSLAVSVTNNTAYTVSVFAKAGSRSWLRIRLENGAVGSGQGNVWFNLSAGSIGTVGAGTAAIQNVGNGWYRCSVTATTNNTSYLAMYNICNADASFSYTGNGSGNIYLWGAQLEEASTASSYQPILSTFENAFKTAFPSHTLYQDSQGVTPVTAVGQPVGLMLDKSEGLTQGPELVTNGDFATDSDWTKGTGWTITNGIASHSGSGGTILQTQSVTAGKLYEISFDVTSYTNGGIAIYADGTYTNVSYSEGHKSLFYVAGDGSLTFGAYGNGGSLFSIDNISVKEIQGSHATQPTSTKRPIYARHPEGGIRNLLNYSEQFNDNAWSRQNTTITANSAIGPNGKSTAALAVYSGGNSFSAVYGTGLSLVTGVTYVRSVYAKYVNQQYLQISGSATLWSSSAYANFDIQNGTLASYSGCSPTIESVGNGWYRLSVKQAVISSESSSAPLSIVAVDSSSSTRHANLTATNKSAYIWGAQLEEATEASNYQKRVTGIDVTESGVGEVYYLKFDGVDDGMFINNLTSASTPLTALFGYSATNAESGDDKYLVDIESGRLALFAMTNVTGEIGYYNVPEGYVGFDAGDANAIKVLTYDLLENDAKIRIDGTQEYSNTNFHRQPLGGTISLFERHANSQGRLAGNMYQTILRAAESTDEEITKAETYVANKTGLKAQVDGIATLDLNFGNNTYTAKNSNGGVI